MPIEVRPRLLYNPDLRSAAFFVPGLIGILMQLVTLFLTSFAIVRERELGTLEQLFVTPVGRGALLLGKLIRRQVPVKNCQRGTAQSSWWSSEVADKRRLL